MDFLYKTDLEECKEMAKNFLMQEVIQTDIPFVCNHPIIENPTYIIDNKLVNIFEDEKAYKKVIIDAERMIDNCNEFMELLELIRKPYRLIFVKLCKDYLTEKDFSEGLIDAFINDEFANNNVNVPKAELVKLFKIAKRDYMMQENDKEEFNKLPNEITVYRGLTTFNSDNIKALSWTLDENKAKWFATRFSQNGKVYKANINKKDVFAYINLRSEKEIILDYRKLENITFYYVEI